MNSQISLDDKESLFVDLLYLDFDETCSHNVMPAPIIVLFTGVWGVVVRCWFQGASILENVYFYSQRKVSEELTKSISDENKLSFEVVMLSRNYTFS